VTRSSFTRKSSLKVFQLSQNRPLAIRLMPPRFRGPLLDRYYRARRDRWLFLYRHAALQAAPEISMQLVPGDRLSDLLAFTGLYEPDLTRRVTELGSKGGKMIDVGANLGYFSLLWATCHSSNECIAFEAAPRNLEILRSNVAENEMAERIRVVPFAAAAKPGKVFFDLGPEDQCGWGGIALENGGRKIEVEAVRVDEIVTSDEPIALLKVDVEGADAWALMGCERLLKSGLVQEVWFEQNKPRMELLGIRSDTAQKYLESMDYVCTAHNSLNDPLVQWSATRR
jgi:FkbM family methyltransferase